MRRFFIVLIGLLYVIPSYGQTQQSLGAKNTIVYVRGMFRLDTTATVFPPIDTTIAKASFPTQSMTGRTGFQNGIPFVLSPSGFFLFGNRDREDSLYNVLNTKVVVNSDSTSKFYTPRQIDSVLNTFQVITSDITATVTNGVKWLIVNPSTTAASITVTAPSSPRTGDILQISFGGTITSGTVVTSFTFSPNTGQSVLQASTPSLVEAGETITYRFYNSKWYRL